MEILVGITRFGRWLMPCRDTLFSSCKRMRMVGHLLQCMQKMATSALWVIVSLLFVFVNPIFAESVIHGKVTKIRDGDSIIVKEGKVRYEIRLWGIDCPEYNQPYGRKSRQISKKLLKGKLVSVKVINRDKYGRLVGIVYTGSKNINKTLVEQGSAWVYSKYCRQSICREWKKSELSARNSRTGLWADTNALAPWKWRHSKHYK